jgi:hypothetical protein
MTIELNVSDKYVSTFLAFINTLTYVEVNKIVEPITEKRLTADEIEALIIERAKTNAKAIENGTLPTKSFNSIEALLEDLAN